MGRNPNVPSAGARHRRRFGAHPGSSTLADFSVMPAGSVPIAAWYLSEKPLFCKGGQSIIAYYIPSALQKKAEKRLF
jgi:hypothetical protein